MGYNVYSFRERGSESSEFKRAAKMAKEALDTMCELAEEMEDRYSERSGYGNRGGYGRRDHEDWEREEWGERRMRDSRGRYM